MPSTLHEEGLVRSFSSEAFLACKAQFVVYSHRHHHLVIPLESFPGTLLPTNPLYINSGAGHIPFDLAISRLESQMVIPDHVLTTLYFHKVD